VNVYTGIEVPLQKMMEEVDEYGSTVGMNIEQLEDVCLENILIHVSPYTDLFNCRLVCRRWNRVSKCES
jgi:hypothetical protein